MSCNNYKRGNKIKPIVTAIIQARMTSVRLPGKSMIDLAGKPLMFHVIERAKAIDGINSVVLATGIGDENKPLIELAESMKIDVFIGSVDNVLERYYLASNEFESDFIIRITGDNPFTDSEYASMAVDIALESKADLCSISNLPLGTAVEIVKKEALDEAYKMSNKPYHFEHVTPFIKEHAELFCIERHPVLFENPFENLRLTIDTEEDYTLAKIIYEELYKGKEFPIKDVLEFLKENKDLVQINKHIKQRSMTQSNSNGR